MAASSRGKTRRRKGSIQTLPSGALRVSVYAGIDPVTKRRHYLKETIPAATPKIEDAADKVLRRLQVQVDERRQPRTNSSWANRVVPVTGAYEGPRRPLNTSGAQATQRQVIATPAA